MRPVEWLTMPHLDSHVDTGDVTDTGSYTLCMAVMHQSNFKLSDTH